MARRFRVIGALGTGAFAPLLAQELWAGGSRQVVLARPAPEAAAQVSASHSDRVVGEQGRVVLDGKTYGVYAYAPGVDLDRLAEERELSAASLADVRQGVHEALRASPVPHGALDGAAIRIGPDGRVRLVGFRGRPDTDEADLDALLEELGEAVAQEGPPLASIACVAARDPLPHALATTTIAEAPESSAVPAKVRTAGIAALTLILGLYSGWFLGSG